MNRQFKYYLQITLIILDFFILSAIFLITGLLFENKINQITSNSYVEFWIVLNLCWLLISFASRTYSTNNIINFESFTKRTVQVYLIWVIAILIYLFFLRKFEISRIFIFITFFNFALGLLFNRFLFLGILYHFKTKEFLLKKY